MAQFVRVSIREKVAARYQHVAGDGHLHAGAGVEQGAIIPYAEGDAAVLNTVLRKVALDEIEFGKHARIVPKLTQDSR